MRSNSHNFSLIVLSHHSWGTRLLNTIQVRLKIWICLSWFLFWAVWPKLVICVIQFRKWTYLSKHLIFTFISVSIRCVIQIIMHVVFTISHCLIAILFILPQSCRRIDDIWAQNVFEFVSTALHWRNLIDFRWSHLPYATTLFIDTNIGIGIQWLIKKTLWKHYFWRLWLLSVIIHVWVSSNWCITWLLFLLWLIIGFSHFVIAYWQDLIFIGLLRLIFIHYQFLFRR